MFTDADPKFYTLVAPRLYRIHAGDDGRCAKARGAWAMGRGSPPARPGTTLLISRRLACVSLLVLGRDQQDCDQQ